MGAVLVTVGNAKMVKSSWPVTVSNDMGMCGTGVGWSKGTMPKLTVKDERTVEMLQR